MLTALANSAVEQARSTNDRVAELSRAAARIRDVVELINTIAGQTNLLALNATIEAARAGDAGHGFAVVASEVKALAEQTSKATGEIAQQISGIQAATEDSVAAIKDISSTIERLSEISSAIAAAVEEQGAATQEISRNIQEASRGTSDGPAFGARPGWQSSLWGTSGSFCSPVPPQRGTGLLQPSLIAGWVGSVSAVCIGCGSDGSRSDAHRHSAAHGCSGDANAWGADANAGATDARAMVTSASAASSTARQRVSRYHRETAHSNNGRCSKCDNGSP
jgi:hypothetical protein